VWRLGHTLGDARNLDLVVTRLLPHCDPFPPYAGIISYSGRRILDDLSRLKLPAYIDCNEKVAAESYRVLKDNRYCGVLIGDTRKGRHYIPISLGSVTGISKRRLHPQRGRNQTSHKTMTTRQKCGDIATTSIRSLEHLYLVFRKPALDEKTAPLKYSKKWW